MFVTFMFLFSFCQKESSNSESFQHLMAFINRNRSSQGRIFSVTWISFKINSLPRVTHLFCAVGFALFLCVLFLNDYSDCDVDVSTDFDMFEARRV